MSKQAEVTVIDITRVVQSINRAGRHAGITAIARLLKVSRPRAKLLLKMAGKEHMVYAYSSMYRTRTSRTCYSPTECGCEVLYSIEQFEERMLVPDDIAERIG